MPYIELEDCIMSLLCLHCVRWFFIVSIKYENIRFCNEIYSTVKQCTSCTENDNFIPFYSTLAFKVICCTFGETFTVQDWHKVAQWILSLARTRITSPASSSSSSSKPTKKISTSSITSNESGGRSSKLSSSSATSKWCHVLYTCRLNLYPQFG